MNIIMRSSPLDWIITPTIFKKWEKILNWFFFTKYVWIRWPSIKIIFNIIAWGELGLKDISDSTDLYHFEEYELHAREGFLRSFWSPAEPILVECYRPFKNKLRIQLNQVHQDSFLCITFMRYFLQHEMCLFYDQSWPGGAWLDFPIRIFVAELVEGFPLPWKEKYMHSGAVLYNLQSHQFSFFFFHFSLPSSCNFKIPYNLICTLFLRWLSRE